MALRKLSPNNELALFEAIQKKFYFDNEDPKEIEFYASICEDFNIDFKAFSNLYNSEELQKEIYLEFTLNREWGVKWYPTVLLKTKNDLFLISNGHAPYDLLKVRVDEIMSDKN